MTSIANTGDKPAVKRREFLKVLGASTAAGAAAACGDKPEKLLPYLVSPDHTVPGVSTYYATTCRECASGCGIIVETRDGRAIKAEGNPDHPVNRGALCARGQSSLQGLYNPDRYRGPMLRDGGELKPVSWDQALQTLATRLGEVRSRNQAGNAVFINQHEQGSFPAFLDQWLAAHGMPAHLSYDAEAPLATMSANREAYGVAWPSLDFTEARVVVSIGADFLDGWGHSVPQQLSWADARAKLTDAPRAVYIGARRSLTGLNSDQWIAAKPGSELQVVRALLGAVGRGGGVSIEAAAQAAGVTAESITSLANELRAAGSHALVIAGTTGPDARAVALAAAEINKALGAVGTTVKTADALLAYERINTTAQVREAVERMNAGNVPIAFFRGANIAHTLAKQTNVAAALGKVAFKVSFTSVKDETSELCDLILPDHHSLESWGDAEPMRGVLSLVQPTMDPVFTTRATADVLIAVAKANPATASRYGFSDYRAWISSRISGGDTGLTSALPRGLTNGSALAGAVPTARLAASASQAIGGTGEYTLQVYFSPTLGDGRGANKPWLQELPDPVTKVLWQTVVEMHGETAKALGVAQGEHVTVRTAAGELTAPAYIYIGIRPDTIAIAAGRGHAGYGRYAAGCGSDAYQLLGITENEAGGWALTQQKATVTKASALSRIVTTEGSARQHDRGIARAMSVGVLLGTEEEHDGEHHAFTGDASHEFLPGLRSPVAGDAQGDLVDPKSKDQGLYDPAHPLGLAKRRWAMTIDLARCTGCSACVTACYAENNIPTVGAPWQGPVVMADRTGFGANITRSREMAWIRLERYFEIDREPKDVAFDASFDTRFVPMMCQHCGNAPCEPVCPVFATYHAPDGLNVQVYNRCVGTRYCSNNCPYKVRYFNWFGYGEHDRAQYAFPEPLHWQLNPDVTVRGKGVMEKCTFCVQRIREAEHHAKLEGREIQGDEFTTACAQACPSRAIIFGDAASDAWTVARAAQDRRAYHVFEELNTFTAVAYLKKVNHPAARA
ncbi:MAG TPA: molybdopterin-dependent oxidoreductase [Gemmatimonadaceae bacterium]|nr:molybdopterin-dependent oxidoreductase [Gemmatimonadaceae bacterium]